MPHSNGLYSLPDTPEPSLSDLFGSTTSDSSIASVVEGVARAHTDDDSFETETDSVHVGPRGTVTSMRLRSVQLTLLVEFLARILTVCLSHARTVSGQVRETVVQSTQ